MIDVQILGSDRRGIGTQLKIRMRRLLNRKQPTQAESEMAWPESGFETGRREVATHAPLGYQCWLKDADLRIFGSTFRIRPPSSR